jgi:colicin import membrane protein
MIPGLLPPRWRSRAWFSNVRSDRIRLFRNTPICRLTCRPPHLAESPKNHQKPKKTASPKIDGATARKAAAAFEKKQREREIQRRKEEAAEARTRERREQNVSRAQAAFEKTRKEHDARAGAIEDARAELDQRGKQEDMRWQELKKRLEIAIKKAGA